MVKHVLKDGTCIDNIEGHVVKVEDAKVLYALIDELNEKGRENNE